MSFSFSFSGDDIDSEDENNPDFPHADFQTLTIENPQASASPRKWSLTELWDSMPSLVSCNTLHIPSQTQTSAGDTVATVTGVHGADGLDGVSGVDVLRRSLFDIRTQLMAEANPQENQNDALLAGLDAGDLTGGVYEGGFKTWECALDLAGVVAGLEIPLRGDLRVVELGAGSAVPSLVMLRNVLRHGLGMGMGKGMGKGEMRFTLCDYNEDVLRLGTLPNWVVNWLGRGMVEEGSGEGVGGVREGELDLDLETVLPGGVDQLEEMLREKSVTVEFVSGSWGEEFVRLLTPSGEEGDGPGELLILASETIYSPDSIKTFTKTVLELLRLALARGYSSARALVAAKKVYFGVGGGTEEFGRCVREAGGFVREVCQTKEAGVARVVLEVAV